MHNDFWRALRSRPRLMVCVAVLVIVAALLPSTMQRLTRALVAWDAAALFYLAATALLFARMGADAIADVAEAQEAGEWTVFSFTVLAVIASFAAVVGEFSFAKDAPPSLRAMHVALVAATLLLSWLSTHTIFTLRYAHEYYDRAADGGYDRGLDFPGEKDPDYWDFFYFSIVLGMTFQVSDVQITSRKLRRLATAHGLLSFMFNTVIIALTVNIGASLL